VPLLMLEVTDDDQALIDFTFPPHILRNPTLCFRRAILAPTNTQVLHYNSQILGRLAGDATLYKSFDTIKEVDDVGLLDIDPDKLIADSQNRFIHGLPPHRLHLKVNSVCRILRNLSVHRALVRNRCVVVVHLGNRIVTVRQLHERPDGQVVQDGEDILLPRITFLHDLRSGHTLVRRQFPIDLAYSTTFNSCQGLTLDKVAVDVTTPVFSHGQLYTALSRIRTRHDGIVRIAGSVPVTVNVTYRDILL